MLSVQEQIFYLASRWSQEGSRNYTFDCYQHTCVDVADDYINCIQNERDLSRTEPCGITHSTYDEVDIVFDVRCTSSM